MLVVAGIMVALADCEHEGHVVLYGGPPVPADDGDAGPDGAR